MKRAATTLLWAAVAIFVAGANQEAFAIPPLVAGDVPTADKGGAELFLGTRYQRTGDRERQIPFIELVLGVSSWQELTIEAPYLSLAPAQSGGRIGFGDVVVGTKMMFLRETERRPGAALSVEAKLNNGDPKQGLGSGTVDYELRLRSQKTLGWFTALGNVGHTFVGTPVIDGVRQERRDVWFLAFGQEYRVAEKTKLVSEVYWRNSDIPGEAASFAGDVGFKQELRSGLQVQAAIGKSLRNGNLGANPSCESMLVSSWHSRFPESCRHEMGVTCEGARRTIEEMSLRISNEGSPS